MPDTPSLDLLPLLRRVSRAFYLSIRVLPAPVRRPVGLAYLLARAADTIADTSVVPSDRRLRLLLEFRRMLASGCADAGIDEIGDAQRATGGTDAERDLLSATPSALRTLHAMRNPDRDLVISVVTTLTEGMEFDLNRFLGGRPEEIRALASDADLDRYTYLIAGCVGEFWTGVTAAHTGALTAWDLDRMTQLGVQFGQGLQLTNILRDVPADLAAGRCYLPEDWLDELGLSPRDLLEPRNRAAARPALVRGIETALRRFEAGEGYIVAIPRRCLRLRLAALWPLLMGLATLAETATNPRWPTPGAPASKVSRGWVYRTIALSIPLARSNSAISEWTRRLRHRVRSALLVRG